MSLEGFFATAAGVAGALIGLLFVAISMLRERLAEQEETQLHRAQTAATLTAFVNALTVSLMALIPGDKLGWAAVVDGVLGLGVIVVCLLSLALDQGLNWRDLPDLLFLFILAATFGTQLVSGIQVLADPGGTSAIRTIAALLVACFLVGISRAWELVGGPSIGLGHQLAELIRPLAQHQRKPRATAADHGYRSPPGTTEVPPHPDRSGPGGTPPAHEGTARSARPIPDTT
ncbi:hypothetical protein [Streptacidiphilus sp. P02-A3a]|uniref:hypothetical protein n=1 Tax=Streptacidiphilus sp. P02-A3a TaxID=2704468 RepID=UPI0015F907B5|nr:hypothetical protein [Streptacidiphilus sp. P02-A3a]QMU73043.1 hypothetical protein GXP74_37185 [Streptacidiphilus sp. P02-A3a]